MSSPPRTLVRVAGGVEPHFVTRHCDGSEFYVDTHVRYDQTTTGRLGMVNRGCESGCHKREVLVVSTA